MSNSIEGKTSGWLSILPLSYHHFDLSRVEFCDALDLRYHHSHFREWCHALDCKKGRLVIQRHNEICDALGDYVAMGFKEVLREPIVKEADDSAESPALIADLSAWVCLATTDCGVRSCKPCTSRATTFV